MNLSLGESLKLKHRLLIPNLLYVILFASILVFFFNSKSLIITLSEEQSDTSSLNQGINHMAFSIKEYIFGEMSFAELEVEYRKIMSKVEMPDVASEFESAWKDVHAIRDLRARNEETETRVFSLTESSIGISDSFIEQLSEKLADKTTKAEVTTLEVLTLPGANRNSNVNYQVQVEFGKLKENLSEKENMLSFLDKLLRNVESDIEKLAGTPFEQMAVDSKELVLKIKDLVLDYIENLETVDSYQVDIFEKTDMALEAVDMLRGTANTHFFDKVLGYFRVMLWLVLIISALGFSLSTYFAGSVSKFISRVTEGLGAASDQIASASSELSSASHTLASGASQQAASIEETSSSLEEMSSMTGNNSDNAIEADNLMKTVQEVVQMANHSMKELTVSMKEISAASEETRKIVNTIDEIAFQTNLLALNAAVEAARAGEAGAGFAVVADEVRNLAMRAAEAAKNTSGLIDDTVEKIQNGAGLVEKSDDAFSQVDKNSSKVGNLVSEIASASKEQAKGVELINNAVAEMDKVVQQNAASAEENASASEEMNAQAIQMKAYVAELVQLIQGGVTDEASPALASGHGSKTPRGEAAVSDVPKAQTKKMLPETIDYEDF